jgi:glyoxylase-like metal-dependent hydrolase (beta-lactamase superfamily II)
MRYRLHQLLTLVIFIFSAQLDFAQNFDTVQIKTNKITESIYFLEGSGGNIGVIMGKDGIIIIDDQFAPLTAKIKSALAAISDKPVRFVINTHFHGDHVGGNENFGGEGAIIVAQENTRRRLSTDQFLAAFKAEQKAYPYDALPKVTFTESLTFHVNGETVQVFHVKNAHTDGDAIIYFKESNIYHTGDVFVRYGLPFIDNSNGGSIDGMIKGVDQIISLTNDQSKIIPGHGALATKKDLIEYRNMLKTIRDRVAGLRKQGKTLKEIIAANPTKEFTAAFERSVFIETVYDSLKKK